MNIQNVPDQKNIEAILGLQPGQQKRRWFKRLLWLAVFLALLAAALWWYQSSQQAANRLAYTTAPATLGDLQVSVTATGTIQPTTQTDVSSEMSGVVRAVNVDYNSPVKKGDVLASLDTERFQAQQRSLQASLQQAEARLADAQATLTAMQLAYARQQNLQKRNVGIVQELESAQAAQGRALAAVDSAKADIAIARSNLELKKLDIAKSQIISPVDGIVLKRAVEPGQTVASSLQAPILFTLAEDLTHMQLEANIDEADIGRVKTGQEATFTVDAFPGRVFPAHIATLQFSPQTTDGVVTYKAILAVDNADLSLRPGMTATALITVQQVRKALLIPNAALRYTPPVAQASESFNLSRLFMPRIPRTDKAPRPTAQTGERTVWVLQGETSVAVRVTTGMTDGKMTEVTKGDIPPDAALITAATRGGKP